MLQTPAWKTSRTAQDGGPAFALGMWGCTHTVGDHAYTRDSLPREMAENIIGRS